ncbi:serine acetyltransferase [Clostridium intestinale]|uniref:serine O-acetyltransferase n=1 Tax=Clostridium intestinale TaxID=36845 RepID=UPI0028E2B92A|nr:serine acetyltransferase [Clostridium intestinale]
MLKSILQDLYRYKGVDDFKTFLSIFLKYHSFRYMFYWRKITNKSLLAPLYKFKLRGIRLKTGIEIPYTAKIGIGFYMVHAYNITINSKAIIGNNVTMYKGATIGNQKRGIKKGAPTIGNNVYIGLNSTIVGKVTIGDNVLIAPNSYVNIDIPSNSIVIGNPCVIYKKDNATENYIDNTVEDDFV